MPSDDFITDYISYGDVQTLDVYPITMARIGSNLYLAFYYYVPEPQLDRKIIIAVSRDDGKTLDTSFGKIALNDRLTIAEYGGNLYAGHTYISQRIGVERVTLDSSGNVTGLVPLGSSAQETDTFPTLFSSPSGLLMAWQTRTDPPFLGFSKFALPTNPNADILAPGAVVFQQFVAKTRPSIAVIGKITYVAFEADQPQTQIVALAEDGRTVLGHFTTPPGFRAPSIAAVGDKLFLVFYWYQNNALNFTQLTLSPDGIPVGYLATRASQQIDTNGTGLISVPVR
jgi:hypothetical protein